MRKCPDHSDMFRRMVKLSLQVNEKKCVDDFYDFYAAKLEFLKRSQLFLGGANYTRVVLAAVGSDAALGVGGAYLL